MSANKAAMRVFRDNKLTRLIKKKARQAKAKGKGDVRGKCGPDLRRTLPLVTGT